MGSFEQKYKNIQGQAYENELAKIVLRYLNEGRPEAIADGRKKKVRIVEEANEYENGQNRIWEDDYALAIFLSFA